MVAITTPVQAVSPPARCVAITDSSAPTIDTMQPKQTAKAPSILPSSQLRTRGLVRGVARATSSAVRVGRFVAQRSTEDVASQTPMPRSTAPAENWVTASTASVGARM